jgi:hypothetical protein
MLKYNHIIGSSCLCPDWDTDLNTALDLNVCVLHSGMHEVAYMVEALCY